MKYQMIPYAWVLFLSALASVGIFMSVWRRRTVPGTWSVLVMMAATTIWCLANALEMMALDLPTKLFWANLQYVSYNIVPLTWFTLALQYTGQDRFLTSRSLLLLLVVPVLTVIIAFTNEWHGLLRQDVFLDTSGSFPVVGKRYGPFFWPYAAYTYLLTFCAAVIFIRAMLSMRSLYKWQVFILLIGLVMPVFSSMLYTFKLSPLKYDITPTLFPVGGFLFAWGLRRFKLFDLIPAAYNLAIRSMGDGIIVFDSFDRIVDINPVAERIIGTHAEVLYKHAAEALAAARVDLTEALLADEKSVEVSAEGSQGTEYYEARCWPIINNRNGFNGKVLLIHDITETKKAHQEVMRQQRITAVLQERERLGRELHDSAGQVLSYLNVQAQAVIKLIDASQLRLAIHYLEKMVNAAQESHADIRKFIACTLESGEGVTDLFLEIQELLRQFGEDCGYPTYYADKRRFTQNVGDEGVARQIIRIVQESLTNIREHAKAQQVWINVSNTADGVQIQICDDGIGFSPEQVELSRHFGLRIMHQRAAEAGIELQLKAASGEGTEVIIEVPLHFFLTESTVTNH